MKEDISSALFQSAFLAPPRLLGIVARWILIIGALQLSNSAFGAAYDWQTLAGNVNGGGFSDGVGPDAHFAAIAGITLGPDGNAYIADEFGTAIRKLAPDGTVTTVAGFAADEDGPFVSPTGSPSGLSFAPDGTLFVAVGYPNKVIRVSLESGYVDGLGKAARFDQPKALALAPNGDLYVIDDLNEKVRKITPDGTVSTPTYQNPPTFLLSFAVDAQSNLFATDSQRIIKYRLDGTFETIGGLRFGIPLAGNGRGQAAQFAAPNGIAFDGNGRLVVADYTHIARGTTVPFQPDLILSSISPDAGNNDYRDGAQFISLKCPRRKLKTLTVELENDGTEADSFLLAGTPGNPDLLVTYSINGQDVTSQITAGLLSSPVMVPEAKLALTVSFLAKSARLELGELRIQATSTHEITAVDSLIIKATSK